MALRRLVVYGTVTLMVSIPIGAGAVPGSHEDCVRSRSHAQVSVTVFIVLSEPRIAI